ncbi:MAG: class I SAM-dependent methyltransferase [Phycisphaerales bacterium]|nr:class I SAM-dependent methyltransferase [Phycisphaerales bacterium]
MSGQAIAEPERAMDRYDLYELCVQRAAAVVPFLRAIHGGSARRLAEDFCGTAAVSREWVRSDTSGVASAIGMDLDTGVLDWARAKAAAEGLGRIELVHGDVLSATDRITADGAAAGDGMDVVFVGNFSIGEIHERSELVGYLRWCRERLRPGGVVVIDTYGGASAWRVGASRRAHQAGPGVRVLYTWEQREGDPYSGRVECALHFDVERGGEVVERYPEVFLYRWRLWSVPELRDAMREVGLSHTSVHADLETGTLRETAGKTVEGEGFIVCVAGRAEGV